MHDFEVVRARIGNTHFVFRVSLDPTQPEYAPPVCGDVLTGDTLVTTFVRFVDCERCNSAIDRTLWNALGPMAASATAEQIYEAAYKALPPADFGSMAARHALVPAIAVALVAREAAGRAAVEAAHAAIRTVRADAEAMVDDPNLYFVNGNYDILENIVDTCSDALGEVPCSFCEGDGFLESGLDGSFQRDVCEHKCPTCKGTGWEAA